MIALIFAIIVGLGIAYFATQNTMTATIHIGNYVLTQIPLYILTVGSLLTGLIIAGIFMFLKTLSTSFALRGKDQSLKEKKLTIVELTKQIHQLELENERLRTQLQGESLDDKSL